MIKKLKQAFKSDFLFYGFFIVSIILIGQLPIILHYFHTPKGYYYPLLDKISFSDYYYLALIRFGMGDDWLLKIPYVVSEHQASSIQVFFVFLGKISLLTGMGPAEIFAIFRVIGGLVYVILSIVFFRTVLKKNKARLAFLFFLFAQPLSYVDLSKFLWQDFAVWYWHFGEAARRVSAMPPHYTLGKGLTIASLVFLIAFFKDKKLIYAVFSGFLAFIAGIIYPPPVFIVLFSLGVAGIVYLLMVLFSSPRPCVAKGYAGGARSPSLTWPPPRWSLGIFGVVVFLIGAILPLLILKAELAKGYPWNRWNQVELGWNAPVQHFEIGYFFMVWLLLILAFFSVRYVFAKKNFNYLPYFLFFWALSSFLLFPFANFLKLGKFRFIEGAQIVPLAILALWGFEYLVEVIHKYKNYSTARLFQYLFLFSLTFYFLIFASLQALWSIKSLWPHWTNVYFRKEEVAALNFLRERVKPNAVVLADLYLSNYIPAFAQVRTIVGFPDFYQNPDDFRHDEARIKSILKSTASEKEAERFILDKKVDYIYYETSVYGEKKLYPSLLESVYKNQSFEIYKVKANLN